MGKRKRLTWYEKICCCCKLRSKFMTIICVIVLYVIPITLLVSAAAACITIGIVYRTDCDKTLIPYYLMSCAVTPFLLLFFIKGVKDKGDGITMWRCWSMFFYCIFAAWLIIGSVWVYTAYGTYSSCPSCCSSLLLIFTMVITCVHWLFLALATIPQVYILTKICCCCSGNAVETKTKTDTATFDRDPETGQL